MARQCGNATVDILVVREVHVLVNILSICVVAVALNRSHFYVA